MSNSFQTVTTAGNPTSSFYAEQTVAEQDATQRNAKAAKLGIATRYKVQPAEAPDPKVILSSVNCPE